jgi:uncharacterized protein involved in type VI secretion and phage assembly
MNCIGARFESAIRERVLRDRLLKLTIQKITLLWSHLVGHLHALGAATVATQGKEDFMEPENAVFFFQIEGLATEFRVESFTGTEGISQLFRFEIYLTSESDEIDSKDAIGKPATLTIRRGEERRYVNGIVSQFWWIGDSGRATTYYAALVPVVWPLTQRYDSRIFQNVSVLEIVQEILKDARIASDYYNVKMCRKNYQERKREYCVQYRESDFNFISRLLEEEGISYYFEHHYDGQRRWHTMVLGDDPSCHGPIAGRSTVIFHEHTGQVPAEEHVFEYRYGHQILPGAVTLRDFNYERPKLDLQGSAQAKHDANLEVYEYPGEFDSPPAGTGLARVRLEEMQTRYRMGVGRSDCCRFFPGFHFSLARHDRQKFNQKYLLVSVTHSGQRLEAAEGVQIGDLEKIGTQILSTVQGQGTKGLDGGDLEKIGTQVLSRIPGLIPSPYNPVLYLQLFNSIKDLFDKLLGKDKGFVYRNEFTCIPASTPFRPFRSTPKPVMQGPQTATVMAPENEKLLMDELGRAKVKFHWDREKRKKQEDHKRTCYIRVACNYAGADHGFQFNPLAGDEVVVDFLEGDPDKPLIVGAVYNGQNRPPLKPENRIENVIYTPYQHRLEFNDRTNSITLQTGGGEYIQMIDVDGQPAENSGNKIKLETADKHGVLLAKDSHGSGISLYTQSGHNMLFLEQPDDAIQVEDRTKNLHVTLHTGEERIVIRNKWGKEILIECPAGTVTVNGGGVDVVGGKVNVKGTGGVKIESAATVEIDGTGAVKINSAGSVDITAPKITLNGAMIDLTGSITLKGMVTLQSPLVMCTGPFITSGGIVSPSYSPGAGNLV